MAVPSEHSEQVVVVKALRRARLRFCAVPNGGMRDAQTARMLRAEGLVAGVPDLLIFDPPPGVLEAVGTALELKRADRGEGAVSGEQREWLAALSARGWATLVGFGAQDALGKLRALGYDV